ncbi:SPOR domain-containing protein [Altericroceibacterium xinjiangense]|uniref:SPOR domain-containing protein n=1 Tax=Altericroceibacterium xinjiangense TaxID=762261 RepID=UPI000F7E1A3A|nr:heavy-metal-associated domain-containing protein [Altericroceibacterium xinjiangense]
MIPLRRPASPLSGLALLIVLAFLLIAGVVWAQVAGDRGIPPIASSTDIQVTGIHVNVEGDSPQDAREKGWREAQILAWKKAGGPDLPDERIESMAAAVVVEQEQIGPRRYIADLGVIFDHTRAGGLLGGEGEIRRSPPLLTLPELYAGGTQTMFEERNPWQRAWAEFQAGRSAIDYVRPTGAGGESLLLTAGQTDRRSRLWWNEILDQFGAADVIMPVAHLRWEWPGGPVTGEFTARYGPDHRYLGSFTLQAPNQRQVGPMLEQAVRRLDAIYARAFQDGRLEPDPTLATIEQVKLDPEIQALIEQGRRAEEAPVRAAPRPAPASTPAPQPTPSTPEPQATGFTIQFATPDSASVEAALASIRGAPGVQGVATTNVAVGGTSTMRVTFGGDLSGLIAALRSRGWSVGQTGNGLYATR